MSSVVIGMASSAPAYSIAASLAWVVLSGVGVKAPGIMLLAFVPMFFISIAYRELNRVEPDCGTVFTWAGRAFGARTGWMSGWALIVSCVISMSSLATVVGSYTVIFVGGVFSNPAIAELGGDVLWSTTAGLIWIILLTWICGRGIEVSAKLQYWLLGIEMIVLLAFAAVALYRVFTGDGVEGYSSVPSLDWLNPFDLPFGEAVAPALLTALFLYWGWDSAVAVNEETADPERTPGRSAVISTVLLLVTYLLVSVAAVAFAGVGDTGMGLNNEEHADDIFPSIGAELFGDSLLGKIMMMLVAVSVLTSAAAATQTTIMPTARGALSMAAFKAIPARFAVMHSKFQTPTWANWGMGIISAAFYLIFTMISPNLLIALVGCLGMLVAVYYGITGLSATWFFRKTLTKSVRHFVMRGIIPLSGAIMMAIVFVYGLQQFLLPDWLTDDNGDNVTLFGYGAVGVVGILSLLAGAVLMVIYEFRAPAFFRGKTLEKRVHTAD